MLNERKMMAEGSMGDNSPADQPVPEEAILQNWPSIKETAENWYKKCSQLPEDFENHPENPAKTNAWNRMQLMGLISNTITAVPEKRDEFEIGDVQDAVLRDFEKYRQQGDVEKYGEMAFFIKKVWPEEFSKIRLDDEMKTKIGEELKIRKNANWRVWPNIFIIAKSLYPELLTEENSALFRADLIGAARSCYDQNWRNYLDILANLRILFSEEAVKLLDGKGKAEILKVVLEEKNSYSISEKTAKAHIVFEN